MQHLPQDLPTFLLWLKSATETYWQQLPASDTMHGAKWTGMEDTAITQTEKKFGIKFAHDHRLFLNMLHTTDKKPPESSFYYNWLTDEKEIRARLAWPYNTILQDIEGSDRVWRTSWGPRPENKNERTRIFNNWYEQAPALVPLTGHRFILSDDTLEYRPVLSIWGADIIPYAWNLRHFLLNEFRQDAVPNNENTFTTELKASFKAGEKFAQHKIVPGWNDWIAY